MTTRRLLLGACLLGSLTGCALFPETDQTQILERWTGKFSAIPKRNPKENATGTYRLTREAEGWQLDFLGPLQSVLARLHVGLSESTWSEPGKPDVTASSAEDLMVSRLGFGLSPTTLFAWLQGHPDPTKSYEQFTPETFRQEGWKVEIVAKDNRGKPARIRAENLDFRLIISVREEA